MEIYRSWHHQPQTVKEMEVEGMARCTLSKKNNKLLCRVQDDDKGQTSILGATLEIQINLLFKQFSAGLGHKDPRYFTPCIYRTQNLASPYLFLDELKARLKEILKTLFTNRLDA